MAFYCTLCISLLQANELLELATELAGDDGLVWVVRQICHDAMEDELHAEMCQKRVETLLSSGAVAATTTHEHDSVYLAAADLFLDIDALGLAERCVKKKAKGVRSMKGLCTTNTTYNIKHRYVLCLLIR